MSGLISKGNHRQSPEGERGIGDLSQEAPVPLVQGGVYWK